MEEVPAQFGIVEIIHLTPERTYINYYGKGREHADYRMFLNVRDNVPTGEWIPTTLINGYKDFTFSVTLNTNAWTSISNSLITIPDGWTINNIILLTASTVELRNDLVFSVSNYINHNNFNIFNRNSSIQSGTITIRVFYIKTKALVAL